MPEGFYEDNKKISNIKNLYQTYCEDLFYLISSGNTKDI